MLVDKFLKAMLLLLLSCAFSCNDDSEAGDGPPSPVPYASEEADQGPLLAKVQMEDRTKWKLIMVNSFQRPHRGNLVFDGKPGTMWHTQWGLKNKTPKPPHEIQIDLGEEIEMHGFTYLPRRFGGINGTIKSFEFYISNDKENWGEPKVVGKFNYKQKQPELQVIEFRPVKGKYIRLVAIEEINKNVWASCAELNVLVME